MSYTNEQFQKHSDLIEKEMDDCSREDQSDVRRRLRLEWPDDGQVRAMITAKKTEISNRATPEQLEEVFKYMGI